MFRVLSVFLFLMIVFSSITCVSADTWDYAADWTLSSPVNHDWSLGYRNRTTGDFTVYTVATYWNTNVPGWWTGDWPGGTCFKNENDAVVTNIDPLQALLHTGSDSNLQVTARWTSPVDQTVKVDARFTGQDAVTARAFIYKNGNEMATGEINGFYGTVSEGYANGWGDLREFSFSGYFSLLAGQTIDFSMSPTTKWASNSTGLSAVITTDTTMAIISGKVTADMPGNPPVAGALVTTTDGLYFDYTTIDGSYAIAVPANASYAMEASKTGLAPAQHTVTAGAAGSIKTQDFVLPAGAISGRVTDEDLNPIAGAKVTAVNVGVTATTDADGYYILIVQPGTYNLHVVRGGYASQDAEFTFASGIATKDFVLVKVTSWDYSLDYSTTDNPNGSWIYGTRVPTSGLFVPYTVHAIEPNGIAYWNFGEWSGGGCFKNINDAYLVSGTQYWEALMGALHPGPGGNQGTARWVAPYDANIVVNARFTGVTATTSDVHLYKNSVAMFGGFINGFIGTPDVDPPYSNGWGDPREQVFQRALSVKEGDTIDFSCGYGSNVEWSSDQTGLYASISLLGNDVGLVEGKVTIESVGQVIPSALIKVLETGAQALSDDGGTFSIALPEGTYTLEASRQGYITKQATVVVVNGQVTVQDFELLMLSGKTYYVKPDGNDSASGLSIAEAWKSIDNGDKLKVLNPNDTVEVQAGTYTPTTSTGVYLINCSGTTGFPITYKTNGRVVINWANTPGHNLGITLDGAKVHDIVIEGFEIVGCPFGVVVANGAYNVTVKNCNIHHTYPENGGGYSCGIYLIGVGPTVIEGCSLHDIPSGLSGVTSAIMCNGVPITARGNIFYNVGVNNLAIGPAIIHGTGGGSVIYNNTFYRAGSALYPNYNSPVDFKNNIVTDMLEYGIRDAASAVSTPVTNDYNIFYNNVTDYGPQEIPGNNDFNADPMFAYSSLGHFQLKSGSPAIDAGIDVGLPYTGNAPDIGALEYSGELVINKASSLGALKSLPNHSVVELTEGKIVTVNFGTLNFYDDNATYSYIQDQYRASGIKIQLPFGQDIWKDQAVKLIGDLTFDGKGEAMINVGEFTDIQSAEAAAPLGVTAKSMFGQGADVTGLQVKIWGRVTFVNSTDPVAPMILYVDDGSGFSDGAGIATGVRVLLPYDIGATLSGISLGDTVSITGIASKDTAGGKVVPVIRMREDADAREFTVN